jgi:putative transposase
MVTLDQAVATLAPAVGTVRACRAVGQPRSGWYRRHRQSPSPPRPPRPVPASQPRALSAVERRQVLDTLHEERFWDTAPASVYATLLDEGSYLCSPSTMYRLLRQQGETGDRRRHATHPARVKPELVASGPNQCWSWDITKLAGPAKWTWYYLYVLLDIYGRYVVGWMVAHREAAALAERLLADTIAKQGVEAGQLAVHADRGTWMTSKPVAMLLADLGVTKSHSRPHVPDDNPYSESQFKTLKHHPSFPDRFGCIQDARAFCQGFFGWYNHGHRHSGIALLTRPTSTTVVPARSSPPGRPSWMAPTPSTLSGLSASHPSRPDCPRPCGSTSPSTQRSRLSNFLADVSHRG